MRRSTVCRTARNVRLYPDHDSLVFYTHPFEQEPNNMPSQADALAGRINGILSTSNDTDWYVCATLPGRLTLEHLDSRAALRLTDSAGTIFNVPLLPDQGLMRDTVFVPDTLRPPLHCAVFSALGVSGGRYILGAVAAD
jgi:hypothetical protein